MRNKLDTEGFQLHSVPAWSCSISGLYYGRAFEISVGTQDVEEKWYRISKAGSARIHTEYMHLSVLVRSRRYTQVCMQSPDRWNKAIGWMDERH